MEKDRICVNCKYWSKLYQFILNNKDQYGPYDPLWERGACQMLINYFDFSAECYDCGGTAMVEEIEPPCSFGCILFEEREEDS